MARKTQPKKKLKRRASEASRADRHVLYENSVQEPEADVRFIDRVFKKRNGRKPRSLREDFCGTAALACHWTAKHPENSAVGVDLDPAPLAWGRKHNVSKLTAEQAGRLKLIEGDVLDVGAGGFDVTCAFNFSYMIFKERSVLVQYFRRARSTLGDEGMFVIDAYGGPESHRTLVENRECDGFEYVWDQDVFDPINNRAVNYIHFEFPDGSEIRKAFRYDWRLWSIPEMRDVMTDAGFSKVEVYWEGTDKKTGEGNDIFVRRESAPDDLAWICYIVAYR
jgi:hypothetical protein